MTNEERVKELRLERANLDEEIKTLENSGRLCDFCSDAPIELIRIESKDPIYEHGHRDVWKCISEISKHIFVSREPVYGKDGLVAYKRILFRQLTNEEMRAAAALADDLMKVYNNHFKAYNPAVNVDGNTKQVIDLG